MAHLSVVKAVEARLAAGFNKCTVYVENSFTETPDEAGAWALLDFPWCRAEWITADEFEEEGGFRILIAADSGSGTHEARAWLDEIAALFRGQSFEGVQCYAPQSPSTNDRSANGSFFTLSITVPYKFVIEG
ncbi:phage tail terminator-like protein [Aureimonas ureilytica]|uniref:phage tail terminator-like protein n=1 Tax=Aureimonas ureilytica TaxID=401562 RepID=UPI000366FE7C|nr:phage tail terminator-like protein [Aureimonas ureilytica]